jgi:hypothetical protein
LQGERAERLLSEFIDAWNRAGRPQVDSYLERAPADERDELASAIGAFLEAAPRPSYSDETLAELMRDPAVVASLRSLSGRSGLLPSLLPRLRRHARLPRGEVAQRLAAALGFPGEQVRTSRYLHELETGTLPASGVSRRVFQALADLLGASREELERAGSFEGLGGELPAAAYFRSPGPPTAGEIDVERRAPLPEQRDELDRLFLGGSE